MNKLDAELMLGALLESGYTLTREADEAGVILYVSCSVRQHAEDRVLSKIGRLKGRAAFIGWNFSLSMSRVNLFRWVSTLY